MLFKFMQGLGACDFITHRKWHFKFGFFMILAGCSYDSTKETFNRTNLGRFIKLTVYNLMICTPSIIMTKKVYTT